MGSSDICPGHFVRVSGAAGPVQLRGVPDYCKGDRAWAGRRGRDVLLPVSDLCRAAAGVGAVWDKAFEWKFDYRDFCTVVAAGHARNGQKANGLK